MSLLERHLTKLRIGFAATTLTFASSTALSYQQETSPERTNANTIARNIEESGIEYAKQAQEEDRLRGDMPGYVLDTATESAILYKNQRHYDDELQRWYEAATEVNQPEDSTIRDVIRVFGPLATTAAFAATALFINRRREE